MSFITSSDQIPASRYRRIMLAAVLAVVTLTLVSLVFFFVYRDSCATEASWKFCKFSRHLFERALGVVFLSGLYCVSRPARVAPLVEASNEGRFPAVAIWLALGGAFAVTAPLLIWGFAPTGTPLLYSVSLWAVGVALFFATVTRIVAPYRVWFGTLTAAGPLFWALVLTGLWLPEIGDTLFPLWHDTAIKDVTFHAVIHLGTLFGMTLQSDPSAYLMGSGSFWVEVGQSCSGVEGLALITVFMAGYLGLFWKSLRPARVIAVLPLLLLLSLCLNVLRITLLVWIGLNVSPVLAVEGFHSHAGWLMFTLLALASATVINNAAWFRRDAEIASLSTPLPPFFSDWSMARIVPFGVFMFSALLASTFFQDPAIAYPFRFLAMAGALLLFTPLLLQLPWRVDALAVGAGLLVAVGWILDAPKTAETNTAVAALPPTLLAIWIATRILGTTFVVPIIEELFFRSYLLERLNRFNSLGGVILAVSVSTIAFAALHDRWLAAGIAGVIFAALVLRPKGRLVDAIVAHMVANGAIALWALYFENWSVL